MSTSTVPRPIPMQEGSAQEMVAFQSQSAMQYPVQQPMQIAVQQPMQLQHAAPNQVQYVVQNPVQPQVQPVQIAQAPVPNRAMYGYFAIAMGIYHGFWTICFLVLSGYNGTFFFCGVVPSLMTVIWIIMDATVCCSKPSQGPPVSICCCACFQNGKWIMGLPMAIATGLRCILYLVLFGILSNIFMDFGEEKMIDDVFFIILTYAAFDAGPMILLTIDWFYYYSGSFDGIFGKETNPMRAVIGQSSVLFVISWSFIAVFVQYADNVIEFTWPWLLHGIISSAALGFCALIQMNGIVAGNKLSSPFFLTLSKIMAAAMGIAVLAVLIFIIEALVDGDGFIPGFVFILYLYYYTALSLPSVAAMASFKTPVAAQEHAKENEMMMPPKEGTSAFVSCET